MKAFGCDWTTFLQYSQRWADLDPTVQSFLLGVDHTGRIYLGNVDPAPLVDAEFLERYVKSDDCRLGSAFRPVHRALVAMRDLPLGEASDKDLYDYVALHLTGREREGIVGTEAFDWQDRSPLRECADLPYLAKFVASRDIAKWERQRAAEPTRQRAEPELFLQDPNVSRNTRRLVKCLMAQSGPVRFHELGTALDLTASKKDKPLSPEELGAAIRAALRYLLVYAWLSDGDDPLLGLWPAITHRLGREKSAKPQLVEEAATPGIGQGGGAEPYGLYDIEVVLVRAATPLRVKSDGEGLYAKDMTALVDALAPSAPPIAGFLFEVEERNERVVRALGDAAALDLLEFSRGKSRGGTYSVTERGKEWLRASFGDKLKVVLDAVRRPEDLASYGLHSLSLQATVCTVLGQNTLEIVKKAVEALATIPTDGAVKLNSYLSYHAELENPLFALARGKYERTYRTLDERERIWRIALSVGLESCLVRFGAIGVSMDAEGGALIRATPIADYVFGRSKELSVQETENSGPPIRVQPDFEIMFLAPSPAAESDLSAFAERIGQGLGAVFRLTPESLRQGARAGLSIESISETLEEASGSPLPDNVAHEIAAWHASTVELKFENVLLLRCPDPETAARAMSAVGKKLELVGDRTLLLSDPKERAKIQRACAKKGVFIESPPEAPKKKARKKARRQRRYW